MCVTLSAAQVRLVLLKEVFSTSNPFQCGKERGVSESSFNDSFNDPCAFGQGIVSLSQIFLRCSEISGVGFMLHRISHQCNGAGATETGQLLCPLPNLYSKL